MKILNRLSNVGDGPRSRLRGVGWLWLVVILALPDCSFNPRGMPPPFTAVFCDIQKPLAGRHCASADELSRGIRLAEAAVALNRGQTIDVAIDDSPDARGRCGGEPEALLFQGAFPEGQPVCVNSLLSPPSSACAVPCQQYFGVVNAEGVLVPDSPPDPSVVAFCAQPAIAHLSTNVPLNPLGFAAGCTEGGKLVDDFADPRRSSDPVDWDLDGQIGVFPYETVETGSVRHNLIRLAATSPPAGNPPFDAGAASSQWISRGDGYVEFSAFENTLSHVLGLSEINPGPLGCVFHTCDDTDPSLNDLDFAISLNRDGRFYVIENGNLFIGPDLNGSFGTYAPGDRFRVSVRDNSDSGHTGAIRYSRIVGPCADGHACAESVFHMSTGAGHYPLRVDTSFREQSARITDVRIVRIQ